MNLILAWKIVETQVQYNISALVHKLDKREKDAFGKECIKKILVKNLVTPGTLLQAKPGRVHIRQGYFWYFIVSESSQITIISLEYFISLVFS